MIDRLIFYIKKYEGVLLYLIFGVLTTVVNFIVYYICYTKFHWINLASNTVAWILSVMFAFITNKIWVFKSKSFQNELVLRELITFVVSRLSTWLLETVIMFVGVDKGILADCKGYCKCACSHTQLCFFKIIYF